MSKKVIVGLSGGVDSSVTALILKKAGYDVIGVYMKNWTRSLPGFNCPWRQDYLDAKRIAVQLKIPFELFDFEKEYFDKVVGYMLESFQIGLTPNPDVMCNQEIKFKLFFDAALKYGADFIATGHYAKSGEFEKSKKIFKSDKFSWEPSGLLEIPRDTKKDQTYFLYRINQKALDQTMFPLYDLKKDQIREIAKKNKLATATKKESMGICFVGKVGIKDFLKAFTTTSSGPILDQHNNQIGIHDGSIFYTIGQRSGLNIGGGKPYYVTTKDTRKNIVYVTSDIQDDKLWTNKLNLTSLHLINSEYKFPSKIEIRSRHLGELQDAVIEVEGSNATISLQKQSKVVAPGQSIVFYDQKVCFGGGIVS